MSGKKVLSLLVYTDVMKVDSLSVSPFKIIITGDVLTVKRLT